MADEYPLYTVCMGEKKYMKRKRRREEDRKFSFIDYRKKEPKNPQGYITAIKARMYCILYTVHTYSK
jgi:hypothetical protein